jgi:hypothetical protein
MGFKIASDGTATDMPRSEYENLFSHGAASNKSLDRALIASFIS